MIKAVTFDFWSTLFRDKGDIGGKRHTWRIEHMAALFNKHGWPGGYTDIFQAIEEVSMHSTEVRLRGTVDFTPEEQVERILQLLGVQPEEEISAGVLEIYAGAAAEFPPEPLEGAVEVVREVSKHYPVGLISNTGISPGSVLRQVMAGAGILDSFTSLTFSNEVNLVKPNPQIFLLSAEKLGVQVSETLHVGDDYEADVVGANRTGAKGVWLSAGGEKRPAAFAVISELRELQEILWGH